MLSQHCTLYFFYILKSINFTFVFTFTFFCCCCCSFCHWESKNIISPGGLILFKLITECSFLSQCNSNWDKQQEHVTFFLYFCAANSCSLKVFSLFVKFMTLIQHYTTYDCTVSYGSHWNTEIKATGIYSNRDISE